MGVEQDERVRVCVDARTDGWMEGWSECVCLRGREGLAI